MEQQEPNGDNRGLWSEFADAIKGQQPVEPEIVEPATQDTDPKPAAAEPAGRTVDYRVKDYIIAGSHAAGYADVWR